MILHLKAQISKQQASKITLVTQDGRGEIRVCGGIGEEIKN